MTSSLSASSSSDEIKAILANLGKIPSSLTNKIIKDVIIPKIFTENGISLNDTSMRKELAVNFVYSKPMQSKLNHYFNQLGDDWAHYLQTLEKNVKTNIENKLKEYFHKSSRDSIEIENDRQKSRLKETEKKEKKSIADKEVLEKRQRELEIKSRNDCLIDTACDVRLFICL